MNIHTLAAWRQKYNPKIIPILENVDAVEIQIHPQTHSVHESIADLFPHLKEKRNTVSLTLGKVQGRPLNIGVVFSGGPAPGGHNVVAGVFDALQKWTNSQLIGFLNGPSGLIENHFQYLTADRIDAKRNLGGFTLLGTGRTKIEKEEQFANALVTAKKHHLDGLIIVGGDDSNTNAAHLAEYFLKNQCKTCVVGIPKTIDGDLQNSYIDISFGFDSAAKTYSETIGNILTDAESQKKYTFFIKIMGRSASHLVLECALRTKPHLSFISEEIAANNGTLDRVVTAICDLIVERHHKGKNYSVLLIPEGLIEFIPEVKAILQDSTSLESERLLKSFPPEIQRQLALDKDPHGNVNVSKIETERLLIALVKEKLKSLQFPLDKFNPQPLFLGYEGRSCFPSNFDANYCYNLGLLAAVLVQGGCTGVMATISLLAKEVSAWQPRAIPLISMIDWEERKGKMEPVIKKGLVDLQKRPFQKFCQERPSWRLNEEGVCPGPMQFFGPDAVTDQPPLILM